MDTMVKIVYKMGNLNLKLKKEEKTLSKFELNIGMPKNAKQEVNVEISETELKLGNDKNSTKCRNCQNRIKHGEYRNVKTELYVRMPKLD